MKTRVSLLLVVVAVVCLVSWTGYAQNQTEITWEYRILRTAVNAYLHEPELNGPGMQGWELVSVTFACPHDNACTTIAYFKRPK